MRLTLRTMLAYMDEQLEPPQMEEIGAKIRESGVASGMIDRIRTSMRKHRMEAPKLEGRGIGKDANSVSEYLDNVLDKDEIPELEQLCLNSDMHLAEVAACHQILSQLPNVEFEIGHHLRDRIYDIPGMLTERAAEQADDADDQAEVVAKPKQATVRDPAALAMKKKKKKKSPQVPEYFKTQPPTSRAWLPLALTAAIVLLGLAFGAYVMRDQWLKDIAKQAPVASPNSNNEAAKSDPKANSGQPESKAEPTESNTDAKPSDVADRAEGDKKKETEADKITINEENPIIESNAAPPPPTSDAPPAEEGTSPDAVDKPETVDGDKAPPTAASKTPTVVGPVPAIAWGVPKESNPVKKDESISGDISSRSSTSSQESNPVKKDEPIPATSDPVPPRRQPSWYRVGDSKLLPRSAALSLVGTRVKLKTEAGLSATLVGPSEVSFQQEPNRSDLTWVLDSARVMFDATNAGGVTVRTLLGGRPVTIKFVSPDSQVAIEVSRKTPPGADPAIPDEYPVSVQLDILRGAIQVKSGDEERLIESGPEGAVVEIDSMGAMKEAQEGGAPLWVDELTAGEATKQASKELSDRLSNIKTPISIALQELASDTRVNVASLAAQALAQLEEIKPLCDQFRDVHYRSAWRTNHAFLIQLIQSKPAMAEMVRGQLETHFPSEKDAIYRLLRGYDKDQFAEEGRKLIDGLASESSLLRVLAYQTLVDLVGPGGRKYQPEDPAPIRAKHFIAWVDAFDAGKLKVKEPSTK